MHFHEADTVVFRHLSDIEATPTAHGLGQKRVMLAGCEAQSAVTQIARTILATGDAVETHVHPTMEEFFLIIKGKCAINVGENSYLCSSNDFLKVPAGMEHSIQTDEGVEMITIGVAVND